MTDSPLPSDFLASTKTNRVGKTTYKRRTRPPIASSSIYEENDPVQVPVHSQLAVKPAAQNKNKRGKMVSQENEIARESIREPPQKKKGGKTKGKADRKEALTALRARRVNERQATNLIPGRQITASAASAVEGVDLSRSSIQVYKDEDSQSGAENAEDAARERNRNEKLPLPSDQVNEMDVLSDISFGSSPIDMSLASIPTPSYNILVGHQIVGPAAATSSSAVFAPRPNAPSALTPTRKPEVTFSQHPQTSPWGITDSPPRRASRGPVNPAARLSLTSLGEGDGDESFLTRIFREIKEAPPQESGPTDEVDSDLDEDEDGEVDMVQKKKVDESAAVELEIDEAEPDVVAGTFTIVTLDEEETGEGNEDEDDEDPLLTGKGECVNMGSIPAEHGKPARMKMKILKRVLPHTDEVDELTL